MLTTTRHIVIYRDTLKDRNRYFGPFVSDTMAYDFCDALPTPLEGGYKYVKNLSPYNHEEARLAADVIIRRRRDGDLYNTICDIVSPMAA